MSIDYREEFEKELIEALESKNIDYRLTCYGIEYKTKMDTWVIDIRESHKEGIAWVKMYHKDPISKQHYKKKRGGLAGYHIQFSREMDVTFIMSYTLTHARKYRAKKILA